MNVHNVVYRLIGLVLVAVLVAGCADLTTPTAVASAVPTVPRAAAASPPAPAPSAAGAPSTPSAAPPAPATTETRPVAAAPTHTETRPEENMLATVAAFRQDGDGYELLMLCYGDGSPTVILENSWGRDDHLH